MLPFKRHIFPYDAVILGLRTLYHGMELCWSLVLLSIASQLFAESNKRFLTRPALAEISFSDIGFALSGEVSFHRYSSWCTFSKISCGSVASAELLVYFGRSCGNIKLKPIILPVFSSFIFGIKIFQLVNTCSNSLVRCSNIIIFLRKMLGYLAIFMFLKYHRLDWLRF